ncbi:heme lyase CcmF/NrfE family subunit [Pelagibaculum spongiae]|uniref:Heme lyase NrfEFG subunit NrfE n=1 Tax=Pelagibaculum spongiae TaxID=2080658 RepID=A0A2V1H0T3_9GAMM|nr:heme lyase CcmF/NrfE family subunit [Pelagibaculum spongiae]PVZ71570.1 heme lyase NrfEFG subunit NrfE [Pelagibaculum spongiae]
MTAEIGHLSLIIALVMAMVQATLPLVGASKGTVKLMALARPAALGQFLFLVIAFVCLSQAFLHNDFTVRYVAQHSNSLLPWYYKLSAVWGGHEGSLLLWATLLAGWSAAVAAFSRDIPLAAISRVLAIMGMVAVGFLLFTVITSNPFDRLLPDFPLDGADLNPLLQDFGLIIHPPTLYMGYVGFAVAFAFALAALLSGRLDSAWARWARPWTTAAWAFLTIGIALGSWWAYYELGWGGWWFWDPVENASLMPWLAGTALIHSLAVTEKRGVFKSWTVLLAILAFSLSLLGTFLVRSGVLTSVHAFASDPTRGLFILMFLCVVVGGSFTLFAIKAPLLKGEGHYKPYSLESALLVNNLLFVVACMGVLLGTLFPLLADAMGNKVSVGPPVFNFMFVPLALGLLALMGFAPNLRWKQNDPRKLLPDYPILLLAAVAAGVGLPLALYGGADGGTFLGMTLVFWVLFGTIRQVKEKTKNAPSFFSGVRKLTPSYKGMLTAHIGVAIAIVGVVMSSAYSVEKTVRLEVGDKVASGPYEFIWQGVKEVRGANYTAAQGQLQVWKDGDMLTIMQPEKRSYTVNKNSMTEAAINTGWTRDLYVAMGEPLAGESWAVRIYYKPFISWIWGGALIMGLGGFWTITDRRYRARKPAKAKLAQGAKTA